MEVSGSVLTVMGMAVVFLALTLLAFTAWLLERIFRDRSREKKGTGVQTSQELSPDIKAVIALALAYQERKGSVHIQHVHESMWMQQTRVYE